MEGGEREGLERVRENFGDEGWVPFLGVVMVSWLNISTMIYTTVKCFTLYILNMGSLLHFDYNLVSFLRSNKHVTVMFITCGRLKFILPLYSNNNNNNNNNNTTITTTTIKIPVVSTCYFVLYHLPPSFWRKHLHPLLMVPFVALIMGRQKEHLLL